MLAVEAEILERDLPATAELVRERLQSLKANAMGFQMNMCAVPHISFIPRFSSTWAWSPLCDPTRRKSPRKGVFE